MTKKQNSLPEERFHSFSTQLAVNLGDPSCAIVYEWIDRKSQDLPSDQNGLKWLFVSLKEMSEDLPYFSTDQIKRILKKLLDLGVIDVCSKKGSSNSYSVKGGV